MTGHGVSATGVVATAAGVGRRRALRPTLRLRLTVLNGILLVGVGAVLLVLASLLIREALTPDAHASGDSRVVFADGSEQSVADYERELAASASREVLVKGIAALLVVGGAGVIGVYLVAGRALRPLHQVTGAARRLSTENLEDARINHTGLDDEVRELADTFDEMLDRLSSAFDSQQRFVANASHELRTPLAVMRTEIDVTLADPDADAAELRRMATVVRDASRRANALIEALLLLARTEAQAAHHLVKKVPVDLACGVAAAVAAARRDADRLGVTLTTRLAPAPVAGDPSLLERLAGNLVENAVRYNHRHGAVWIRAGLDDATAYLVVGNTGHEVDPAEVAVLFEPFRRGGQERTASRGSGLGLSIVRAIAGAHGGTVHAAARAEGGLEVTVRLPAKVA